MELGYIILQIAFKGYAVSARKSKKQNTVIVEVWDLAINKATGVLITKELSDFTDSTFQSAAVKDAILTSYRTLCEQHKLETDPEIIELFKN